MVRELCAVQAQDYDGAKWALSQRTNGVTDAEIEAELTRGAILRTHVLRPTWHFVAPEDLRWMLALTGARVNMIMGRYDHALGMPPSAHRRSQAVMEKVLQGGKHLTRPELAVEFKRAGIRVVNGEALARIVMRAEQAALIVSGPRRGKQFTYGLMDERAKPMPALERDDALGQLTRRYFATRGPATDHDCAWWSGLTLADVRRGIQVAGHALQREEINGRSYWFVERELPKAGPSAHLLPNYDEYFIGYKDRSAIGKRIGSVKRVTGGNALIAHVVSVDGQLVGGWKRVVDKKSVDVKLDLVVRLTPAERKRVDAAIKRFKAFRSG